MSLFPEQSGHAQHATGSGEGNDGTDHRTVPRIIADDFSVFLKNGGDVFSAPARFRAEDWMVAGAATGAIALSMLIDEPVRDFMNRNQDPRLSDWLRVGRQYGNIVTPVSIAGALYVAGLAFKDGSLRQTGLMVAEATAFAGITTTVIKIIAGRSRPFLGQGASDFRGFQDQDDYFSFPSGHATVAFALTTVLADRIDHPVATIVLYLLAGSTVLQRMHDDRHWLSDVLAGSMIGYVFGKAVVRLHEPKDIDAGASGGFLMNTGSPNVSRIGFSIRF